MKRHKSLTTRSERLEDEKDQYIHMATERELAMQSIDGERGRLKATVTVQKTRALDLETRLKELANKSGELEIASKQAERAAKDERKTC